MKKPLRRILRVVLKYLSQAVLYKHRPEIIAIVGDGQTAIAREAVYTVFHGKFAVRRNLEFPEAEFSVPLTIFGTHFYPPSYFSWVSLILKTIFQLLILNPYKHILVLELSATNPETFNYWLEITKPKVVVVCGKELPSLKHQIPSIKHQASNIILKVPKTKNGYLNPYLNVARKVGKHFKINDKEIDKALEKFELPPPRIRFLAGKEGFLIVDSTYYYFPPPLKTVLEIVESLPGKKLFLEEDKKFLDEKKIKNYDVVVVRGPRQKMQPILEEIALSFYE